MSSPAKTEYCNECQRDSDGNCACGTNCQCQENCKCKSCCASCKTSGCSNPNCTCEACACGDNCTCA
ncbi:MAG: hypothetical protein MHM6MM_006011 [Cercozoa sp. M6MM]